MKIPTSFCFLFFALFGHAQSTSVFTDFSFDSSYTMVALSTSFSHTNQDDQTFTFFVSNLSELNRIKSEWTVKNVRPKISMEEHAITVYLLKKQYLVSSHLLIYPEQGIINYKNAWYDFDMNKFKTVQAAHPLRYRSQFFHFPAYLDYEFFRDSVQSTPNFLFLIEPTPQKFAGSFTLVAPRDADASSPYFVLHDVNKELAKQNHEGKFLASYVANDPYNLSQTDSVAIRVACAEDVYQSYKTKRGTKRPWTPATFDTKVIFKD